MVNFNGVELKGIKYFPDHEGCPCPFGNIYFEGKKVGSFRYDAWGGDTVIEFKDRKSEVLCRTSLGVAFDKNKLRVGKNGETPIIEDVVDDFIQYSLDLIDYEKHIKKITKKYNCEFGILVPYVYRPGGLDCNGNKMMHFYYQKSNGYVIDIGEKQDKQILDQKKEHPADLYFLLTANDFSLI